MSTIKPKNKTCIECGSDKQPWYSKRRCKSCASKSYAKTTARNRVKNLKPASGQADVFEEIWDERQHICFVSATPILDPVPSVFAHVLSKALNRYPKFKLYKKNIVLLQPSIHTAYDHGYEEQRQRMGYAEGWAKLYALRDELITEYNNLYKKS